MNKGFFCSGRYLVLLGLILFLLPLGACGQPNGRLKADIENRGTSSQASSSVDARQTPSGVPPVASPRPATRFPDVALFTSERYGYRAFFLQGEEDVTEAVLSGEDVGYTSFVLAFPAASVQEGWKLEDGRPLTQAAENLLIEVYRDTSDNQSGSFDMQSYFREAIDASTPLRYALEQANSGLSLELRTVRGVSQKDPQQIYLRIQLTKAEG